MLYDAYFLRSAFFITSTEVKKNWSKIKDIEKIDSESFKIMFSEFLKFPDAIAKGFFLPNFAAEWDAQTCRPPTGEQPAGNRRATGKGSPEGFWKSKVRFEYIIQHHFSYHIGGVDHIRIALGCLFLEISIFRSLTPLA